jgi:hypothetical protein
VGFEWIVLDQADWNVNLEIKTDPVITYQKWVKVVTDCRYQIVVPASGVLASPEAVTPAPSGSIQCPNAEEAARRRGDSIFQQWRVKITFQSNYNVFPKFKNIRPGFRTPI